MSWAYPIHGIIGRGRRKITSVVSLCASCHGYVHYDTEMTLQKAEFGPYV